MIEKTHTAGPWSVVNHSWAETSVVSSEGTVCRFSIEDKATEETQFELEKQMEADATLVAAAPDLLNAVEAIAMQHKVAEQEDEGDIEYGYDSLIDIARATLALMKGQHG